MATYPICISKQNGYIFLNNSGPKVLERMRYITGTTICFDDEIIQSSTPSFEIGRLKQGESVMIEKVDPFEDGIIWWRAVEAVWEDGQCDVDVPLTLDCSPS